MTHWKDSPPAYLDNDDDRGELIIAIGVLLMAFFLGVAIGCVFG